MSPAKASGIAPAVAGETVAYTIATFDTYGDTPDSDVTITQGTDNPSGALTPAGKPLAAAFVEIDAPAALRDNLKTAHIAVHYDPSALPAGTDESSLQLYLWDTSEGSWKLLAGSQCDVVNNIVSGDTGELSQFGVFGSATQAPPPSVGGGVSGGGGGASGVVSITVPQGVVSGIETSPTYVINLKIDASGYLQGPAQFTTQDGLMTLAIASGARLLSSNNNPLSSLTASVLTSPPPVPPNNALIIAYTFGPDGAKFSPALTFTVKYDAKSLPAGMAEKDLYLAYYDGTQWQALDSTVDLQNKTVATQLTHFSSYALLGKVTPPPAVSPSPSPSASPSVPPSTTPKPTVTPTVSPTVTPAQTPSVTPTQTPTATPTQTPTATPVVTPATPSPTPKPGPISGFLIIIIVVVVIAVAAIVAVITVRRRRSS
jgi:hypothetical protein